MQIPTRSSERCGALTGSSPNFLRVTRCFSHRLRRRHDRDAFEAAEREQVALIAGDDEIGLRSERGGEHHVIGPARVKVVVASVMQPSAEYAWRWQPG